MCPKESMSYFFLSSLMWLMETCNSGSTISRINNTADQTVFNCIVLINNIFFTSNKFQDLEKACGNKSFLKI